MLSKKNKAKKDDFLVLKKPKIRFFRSDNLSLKFSADDIKNSKFAVVLSKKKFPKATQRNIVKRRIFAVLGKKTQLPTGIYFFQPEANFINLKNQEVLEEISFLLSDLTKTH